MNVEPGLYEDTREGGTYRTDGEVIEKRGELYVIFYPTYEDDVELISENRLRYMTKLSEALDAIPYDEEQTPENSVELYEYACGLDDALRTRDTTLSLLKYNIKDSLFTGKLEVRNGEVCIREKENMKNSTIIFYHFGTMLCPYPKQGETVYFYRGVRPTAGYNPREWEVGETFYQYIPFSTSIAPEFAMKWSGDSCCFFKINVKVDEKFFFICADDLLTPRESSQMEATLPPGVFEVRDKLSVTYKGSTKTFLELDYTPWSVEQWVEIFDHIPQC